jgi:hypothetical protein
VLAEAGRRRGDASASSWDDVAFDVLRQLPPAWATDVIGHDFSLLEQCLREAPGPADRPGGSEGPPASDPPAAATEDLANGTPSTENAPPEQIGYASRAAALLIEWSQEGRRFTVAGLAKAVGVNRTTIYRNPRLAAALRAARTGTPPNKGYKDAKGNLDAYGPEEDDG